MKSICSTSCSSERLRRKTFFKSKCLGDQLIRRLCRDRKFSEAIKIACEQRHLREAVNILKYTDRLPASVYSSLLQLCVYERDLESGRKVHSHIIASGSVSNTFIWNRMLDMYTKCGSITYAQILFDKMVDRDICSWNTMINAYAKTCHINHARNLFDEMPGRDTFSWTAMISGYVLHNQPEQALDLYRSEQMSISREHNKFTVSSALAASAAIHSLRCGKEIHGHIVRAGVESDTVVWSALSDMYGECGNIQEARCIFDMMPDQDIVSWTAMIGKYCAAGRWEDGVLLFKELMRSEIMPNEVTFAGVLNACADHAAGGIGRQFHGYMIRFGFDSSSFAASSLVHMYSRCGDTENARMVFKQMVEPDLVSWTSLIIGYARNGQSCEAINLFELLLRSGCEPDQITFIGVLSACVHAGLVDKGLEYFHSIKKKHGLVPIADHYACIIDLLSRSGRFKEANDLIDNMPVKPDRYLWASFLGGCKLHGNVELAEQAAEALFEMEPENGATYVTLGNIYAEAGLWGSVNEIRKLMGEMGVVKKPGRSWTEIDRQVHVFFSGDASHPKSKEMLLFLAHLSKKMTEGYIPENDFMPEI